MSLIEKVAKREGMELRADSLAPHQRTVKCFQRLIAAIRAAEGEVQDRLSDAERQLNESLQINLRQQEEISRLRAELLKYRLNGELVALERLTVAERTKLLTVAVNDD